VSAAAPWSLRLVERLPWSPLTTGVVAAAGFLLAYALLYLVWSAIDPVSAGALHDQHARDLRVIVIHALMLGVLLGAQVGLERAAQRAADEVRALHGSAGPTLLPSPLGLPGARVAGWTGLGLLTFLVFGLSGVVEFWLDPDYWILPHGWMIAWTAVAGWMIGRFAFATLARSREVSQLAVGIGDFDLLDPAAFQPCARYGLRVALLWVALVAVASLHLVDLRAAFPFLTILPVLVGIPAAALLLPARGARNRVREAKALRLAELRAQIRAAEAELEEGGASAAQAAVRLPAFLALEARVDAVHEWPFDAPSLLRFGLYLALGLGSWLGAAAVERLLDRMVG
jgi:hypothetical protein